MSFTILMTKEGKKMQVEIKIDKDCSEPKVIIITDEMTDEINTLIKNVSQTTPSRLVGYKNKTATLIDITEIFKIYSASGKVFAVTENSEYTLKLRLYEIEERVSNAQFVRISNSEIINFKKVKHFDMGLTGTICVTFSNGSTTYASRRYVNKIKKLLEL